MTKKEQKKRWLNALKQAAKVNRLQKKQNVVLLIDDEFVPPSGRFYLNENRLVWKDHPDSNCCVGYFINDVNLANGLELTVKRYNSTYFGNVKYCESKHFKSL